MTVNSRAARTTASRSSVRAIALPSASAAKETQRLWSAEAKTQPSSTSSAAGSTPSLSAPSSRRTSRASAAAARSTGPVKRVVIDPTVELSQGQRSVSPITMSTFSSTTRSSSAAICANEVCTP